MADDLALPPVPLVDVGRGGALALYRAAPQAAQAQIDDAQARFTRLGVAFADRRSRLWLERAANPLRHEIAAVAEAVGRPGAYLLNLSYEWGCTAAVAPDPAGRGMRMLRTLDWPFHGLGRNLVAARSEGPAGHWLGLTWPGFAGVLTAVARGRFAVAFNQPPMHARRLAGIGMPKLADWALDRLALLRRRSLPPAHLLRLVCDEAADYHEARRRIVETPLAAPCFVTLAGVEAGQGCVIERTPENAVAHEAPAAVANHWLSRRRGGHPRTAHSEERLAMARSAMTGPGGFAWLQAPILNPTTRLAAELNPATGAVLVQGWEADGPATRVTVLQAP